MTRNDLKPGDVCLAFFPLGGVGGRKLRPVLVLTGPLGSVPEYLVAYVTSAEPTDGMPSDFTIDPAAFVGSGLTVKSFVRSHKLASLHRRDLIRSLGAVPDDVLELIRGKLRALLGL